MPNIGCELNWSVFFSHALVFFFIFSQKFFFEYGIPGFGSDVDVGQGFALFFRMCFGAVAVGLAFGAGMFGVIYYLNRRFNYEESVVQVTATITTAYLTYYTSEAVLGMSGVIAVVTLGFVTKFYCENLFSDIVSGYNQRHRRCLAISRIMAF